MPAIFLERPLFIRERNDGLYRTITYLCAKMLDEILITVRISCLMINGSFIPYQCSDGSCSSLASHCVRSCLTLPQGTSSAMCTLVCVPCCEQPCTMVTCAVQVAGSLLIAIMVYFGVHLQGNFALFWLNYLTILIIGISECRMAA